MTSHQLLQTRRQFFGRTRHRHRRRRAGVAARRRPARRRRSAQDCRRAAEAALRAEGEAGHLSVHVRRTVAHRLVRLQAEAQGAFRPGPARVDPHGPAHHRHDLRAEDAAGRAVDVQVRTARQGRHMGQRAAAEHRDRSPTTSPSSSRCTPRRSITTRPSRIIQTGSQQPGRPSLGAWLSYGLGSLSKNLPAFVVQISQGSGNKTDQPIFSRLWGSGFLPSQHQGVRFRSGSDPGALSVEPARRRSRRPAEHARCRRRAEQARRPRRSAIRKSTRASRSTRWRSACRRACRT